MLILYLAIVLTGVYWVLKTLAPEMAKPPLPKAPSKENLTEITSFYDAGNKIHKLDTLLAEKNKNIQVLQKELQIFHVQQRDFDKIKSLMQEEIQRLREQNRIFRSELGLPTIPIKENSLT